MDGRLVADLLTARLGAVSTGYLPPELLAIASTQRGLFTAAQAREAGLDNDVVQALRKGKMLTSVRRGVYAVCEAYDAIGPEERHRVRAAALVLALGAPGVLSHHTAALEHGFELLDPDLSHLHVTRSLAAGTRHEAGVHHHAAELSPDEVVRLDDLVDVTAAPRTAVDVARETERFECALAAFDSALRAGVSREELTEVMLRCRSWPGARLAGGALSEADGRAANPGESWSRGILIAQGLRPDDIQVPVYDGDRLVAIADFGWDGVLGELDGKLKYGVGVDTDPGVAGLVVWREKLREDDVRDLGWELARWGYADHYRPGRIGAVVRRAMARAAQRRRWSG